MKLSGDEQSVRCGIAGRHSGSELERRIRASLGMGPLQSTEWRPRGDLAVHGHEDEIEQRASRGARTRRS